MTQVGWEDSSYIWEVRDFLDLREMAKEDPLCSASRLESPVFKCFSLWLFPNGQEQHDSVGLIDLAIMFKGKRGSVRAKWTACFLDERGETIPRTRLSDPLKKYSPAGDGRRFSYAPSPETLESWLSNGALRIHCQAFIALDCKSTPVQRLPAAPRVSPHRLKTDVVQYALQPESHDVRVWCCNSVTSCCRFLLAARSTVLRKMLNGPFREADAADIHLTDISPYAAHQMLLFIHTDTCEALKELKRTCTPDEKRQRREALMGLISAADKYDVQGLKEECEHQLAALVDEDSVLDVLLFAESRNFTRLLDAGQKLLQGMPALRLWTNWRNRQTGVPNQLPACETRESTGESCNNWGGADGPEMLSVCAAAAVS